MSYTQSEVICRPVWQQFSLSLCACLAHSLYFVINIMSRVTWGHEQWNKLNDNYSWFASHRSVSLWCSYARLQCQCKEQISMRNKCKWSNFMSVETLWTHAIFDHFILSCIPTLCTRILRCKMQAGRWFIQIGRNIVSIVHKTTADNCLCQMSFHGRRRELWTLASTYYDTGHAWTMHLQRNDTTNSNTICLLQGDPEMHFNFDLSTHKLLLVK